MNKFRLNINGKEVTGVAGQTILEVARENDIFIPTLCYDERTKIYGSCGLCMCEVEGNPKLCKACATEIAPGMVIRTNTERVIESRKTNLELLLTNHTGDCRPPCVLACPAQDRLSGLCGPDRQRRIRSSSGAYKGQDSASGFSGQSLSASLRRKVPQRPCGRTCFIQQLKRFAARP